MQTKKFSNLSKLSTYSLIASLALVLFALMASVVSFLGSFTILQAGLKDRFLALDYTQKLSFGVLTVAILMGVSLFSASNFLSVRIEEIEESVGSVLLSVLSFILSILLLAIFYFSFSYFISYLSTRFWS